MARPTEFDRDEALASAIKVFSSHGYEGSSTATLLERMGIGRQSLYGAFGDKRRLFLEALKRHNAESLAEIIAPLDADLPCLEALEASLLAFARPGADPRKGSHRETALVLRPYSPIWGPRRIAGMSPREQALSIQTIVASPR